MKLTYFILCRQGERTWLVEALWCDSLADAERQASMLNDRFPDVHHEPRVELVR